MPDHKVPNTLFPAFEGLSTEVKEDLFREMVLDPTAMVRRIHGISIDREERDITPDRVIVTVYGTMPIPGTFELRSDVASGASVLTNLFGMDWSNAVKAAETQAKRRLTTSLTGYGFRGSAKEDEIVQVAGNVQNGTSEPEVQVAPAVNNSKAEVTEDTRPEPAVAPTPAAFTAEDRNPMTDPACTLTVPAVTEESIGRMHQAADILNALDRPSQADAPAPKPAAPAVPQAQAGFFDDEPTEVPGPATIPNAIVPATPSITEVPLQETVSVPSTTLTTPAVPAAPTGLAPEPVKDIVIPEPVAGAVPSQIEYREFTARCTKLVREVLSKQKGSADLLLPYLRTRFGVKDLAKANTLAWQEALGELEAAGNLAAVVKILKGGK